jgi:hypothetical protein
MRAYHLVVASQLAILCQSIVVHAKHPSHCFFTLLYVGIGCGYVLNTPPCAVLLLVCAGTGKVMTGCGGGETGFGPDSLRPIPSTPTLRQSCKGTLFFVKELLPPSSTLTSSLHRTHSHSLTHIPLHDTRPLSSPSHRPRSLSSLPLLLFPRYMCGLKHSGRWRGLCVHV